MSRVVFWDFDGTLAYSSGKWRAALMATLDEYVPGHGIPPEAIGPFLQDGFPWHRPDLPHPELSGAEAWWAELSSLLVRAYVGVGLSERTARRLAPLVRKRVTDPHNYRLFDDTIPALEQLTDAGWDHAVLSNHVPELAQLVAGVGLGGYVTHVVCSAETGYEKPHPEAFLVALERTGDPTHVWMVGDDPEADVRGAEAVGIPAILVRTQDANVLRHADDLMAAADIIISE